VTAAEFSAWLKDAVPGERVCYFQEPHRLTPPQQEARTKVFDALWSAEKAGRVLLFQQPSKDRHGWKRSSSGSVEVVRLFDYFAQKVSDEDCRGEGKAPRSSGNASAAA
tara:strand:+ start:2487 stop:2813 length:327 start_codon:yes stop_codon:yes gene_type:complete